VFLHVFILYFMAAWPKCLHNLAYFIELSQIKQLTPSTTTVRNIPTTFKQICDI